MLFSTGLAVWSVVRVFRSEGRLRGGIAWISLAISVFWWLLGPLLLVLMLLLSLPRIGVPI